MIREEKKIGGKGKRMREGMERTGRGRGGESGPRACIVLRVERNRSRQERKGWNGSVFQRKAKEGTGVSVVLCEGSD